MAQMEKRDASKANIYLVGSGIASLASAVYLVKDAGVEGNRIHVMEQRDIAGGALDGSGEESEGYLIRGGRMHEDHYVCYWDLLSHIPSLEDPEISVTDECKAFNAKYVSNARARLMRAGEIMDVSSYGLSKGDQAAMLKLWFAPEIILGDKRIEDWFSEHFFETNFWLLWTSMFAFQKWSSLAEMRRYFIRFIHLLPGMNRLEKILRTKYNQYDSVVLPLRRWLEDKGVQFEMRHQVIDIEFDLAADSKRARVIHYLVEGEEKQIMLGEEDCVFITNGSIVESADTGSMDAPPVLYGKAESGAWKLWEKIAAQHEDFGNPGVFCDNVDLQ
ncbi:MAG TPA: oleate hydratase, partial [Thiolapillus brandeum]|nr:oleate hydratase [Thiolapillus brandeum]